MSSNSIVKSVAKELKYYCDVKRLEDGFDLSGLHTYRLDNNQLLRLTQESNGPREERVKRKIKKHMTNYHFLLSDPALPQLSKRTKSAKSKHKKSSKIPEYYYIYSARPQLLPRSTTSISSSVKTGKRRTKSGRNVTRSTTSESMVRTDTDRLVNAAAKLLVATETVESIDSVRSPRPQGAPRSFEENRRPHTAKYSYDINGRKIFNTQLSYYDDSSSTDAQTKRSKSARSPVHRPDSPTPSYTTDDTNSSSISVDNIQRLKTPAPRPPKSAQKGRNRTYISDNKQHSEEEVAVSKTIQTQDNGTVGIQTEKHLLEKYDHMEDEVKEGPWAEYQIFIQTGNTNGASTKADVRMTLYGEKGRSKEYTLTDSKNHKIKFQKGKEDCFMIAAHHVGKLKKIKIGHDRPELSYAWYLESVTVSDMCDKRVYDLPCGRWLSGQNGDKNTYLYLPVKRDRAFVESLETSCESTKPKEGSLNNKQQQKSSSNKKQRKPVSESETDQSEYTTSVEIERKENRKPEKNKKRHDKRDSSSTYTSDSYTNTQSESETETESESEEDNVISLKDSPKHKRSSEKRKISNDSSNKANGPTFTFRLKDGKNKGETENVKEDKKKERSERKNESDDNENKKVDKDYLKGYKAGLEAAEENTIKHRESKLEEEKKVLIKGQTIHEAAWNGNIQRIKELVDHFPELKESKDENGMVPLHKSVINGQTTITKWLAASGVDLNKETPTSYTPMHLAALHGHVNIMMILSAMGAEVSCETIEKQTPLHLAARGGHLECVKWLVANRSVLTAEDNFGRKPVYLAEEFEQDTVADFLRACEKELNNPNSGFARMYGRTSPETNSSQTAQWHDDKETNASQKAENGSDEDQGSEESADSVNHNKNIEERRKSYDEQHVKMTERGKSFLDSIRQDIEEDD